MSIGRISHIQRFSTKDGPGIRTSVFLKGCNLHCAWCHNPETIPYRKLLQYNMNSCVNCGSCALVCPTGATTFTGGVRQFNYLVCTACGECTRVCMQDALEIRGTDMKAEELFQLLMRDAEYYETSGGGVTFSGGEPLLQSDFVKEVATLLSKEGISVAVDSALQIPWATLESLLDVVDLLLIDIKSMDVATHKRYVGVTPEQIWENIRHLYSYDMPVIIRMPIIAGVNDDMDTFKQVVPLLEGLKSLRGVELLSYHNLGVDKAKAFGGALTAQQEFSAPSEGTMKDLGDFLESQGITILG
ncbi:MAG: glycyl-radical enzyme activating protein [Spirochaetia bacterium]|nr:glycyl-radical enzyme activating protein [Spirochaetia bacterium]